MAITVAELVAKLQTKDQTAEVEFIVVKTTGKVVTADISVNAKSIGQFLQMLGSSNHG